MVVFSLCLLGATSAYSEQSYRELTRPPVDTLEAERVRIWVPVERTPRCTWRIDILNKDGSVVRHMLTRLLTEGYYNFYWDKLDDSGRYAAAGDYDVRLTFCDKQLARKVEAVYFPWENQAYLSIVGEKRAQSGRLELTDDSALVTFKVATKSGKVLWTVFQDSLLSAGVFEISLDPPELISRGTYFLQLYIDSALIRERSYIYRP